MSLTALMQIVGFAAGVGEKLTEDPDLKERFAALKAGLGAGLTISEVGTKFANKSLGTDLLVTDKKLSEALKKNPEGIFSGALPKGGNFDLPEDMMGGGFGLKMPKDWNKPKNKGIFDFTPQDTLQDQWNPGLAIYG